MFIVFNKNYILFIKRKKRHYDKVTLVRTQVACDVRNGYSKIFQIFVSLLIG